jgi:hypothetical protein
MYSFIIGMIVVLIFVSLNLILSCSSDSVGLIDPNATNYDVILAKKLPNKIMKSKAIEMAEEFLQSECVLETNYSWSISARVVDAFPVYMD